MCIMLGFPKLGHICMYNVHVHCIKVEHLKSNTVDSCISKLIIFCIIDMWNNYTTKYKEIQSDN